MSSQSRKPKKVSKAAMSRQLSAVQEQNAQRRELPAALVPLVDHYTSPAFTCAQLDLIRPFLRAVVTASNLAGVESARKHCTHIASIAGYALQRGLVLDSATVMTTTFIDEYTRLGMAAAGDPLKAERRRRLLALATVVNPGPTVPAKLTPIGHSSVKPPYDPSELAVIKRVCPVQPTETKRRNLSTVVALGAGAGLDSVDLRNLLVRHIEDLGPDGLLVHVQDPRPRIVPVRAAFEELLRSAVAGRGGEELLLGQDQNRRNTAARAVDAAALYRVPHIEQSRLRATWLADLMTDTVPIGLLLQAAGLKSARTLTELLPHLDAWVTYKQLPARTADALRGGTR